MKFKTSGYEDEPSGGVEPPTYSLRMSAKYSIKYYIINS